VELVSVSYRLTTTGRFIGETLECLRAQTYSNCECIIVDDGFHGRYRRTSGRFHGKETPRFKFLRQETRDRLLPKIWACVIVQARTFKFLDATI
jgi:hypothetical protein